MSDHPVQLDAPVEAFFQKASETPDLLEKLKAATDSEKVVALAKSEGFSLKASDIDDAAKQISDQELENVAGGGSKPDIGPMPIDELIEAIMRERARKMEERLREMAERIKEMNERTRP
jgi:predicted ribosomally synthesized peptide with nif11-like leader